MSKFVPLAKDQHANLRVIQSGDYTRFKQQNLISLPCPLSFRWYL